MKSAVCNVGGESLDARDLLREIQTARDGRRRDQCAFELALALSRPGRPPAPGLAEEIGKLIEDKELPAATRAYLALALGRLGGEARPFLTAALLSDHGEVRAHAGLALGSVGTAEEVPALLALGGCTDGGGTGSPGVGTVAGAAAGAGAGRLLFGNSTTGMLIGGAAGGLAGNMTLDRQAEQRRQQQAIETRRTEQQLQLDFERQRALQQEQTRIEIEEQRLFNEWRRQQGV